MGLQALYNYWIITKKYSAKIFCIPVSFHSCKFEFIKWVDKHPSKLGKIKCACVL